MTRVSDETRYRIDCDGLIQGPPDWLQPGQLNMPMFTPTRPPSRIACSIRPHHSSLKTLIRPAGTSSRKMLPISASPIPKRAIASRSRVIPSLEMLSLIQYQ